MDQGRQQLPIFQPSQLLSVNYCLFSVVIVVGNHAMCGNFSPNTKKIQVIQQDNPTRKSQRVSIHIVFVTNKLVKSKPRLIRSIHSILQPCTATSDILSLSRLPEPPPVQSTPQAEHRRHQASIHRPACESRGPLRKPCPN